nr:protein SIEVE ELEMENT OCCLUSION B-like [Ipomoea batatas]
MVLCIATHMILKRVIDFISKGGGVGEFMKRDSKVPLFKNMVKEMTLSVRHLVSDIDEKISDFAKEMDNKLKEWCDGIESDIENSVDANEHIFFIGGKDIKWVKTFASRVLREIHFNPQLTIKMAYVGSNNKVTLTIRQDRICETFDGRTREGLIFWINLQSMFLSRIKFLDATYGDEESDEIVKGLKFLLSYETEGVAVDGWALQCKGNKIVLYDLGDKMLAVMNEYEKWKESAIIKGFDQAFKDHHHEMFGSTCTPQHHPCALEYPSNSDKMDEVLASVAETIKNFAVIYLVDITEVPDFNTMYELYDPSTAMFFLRNKHIMIDLGTGNNNKINWALKDKQELH